MAQQTLADTAFKQLVKNALVEVLEERKDLLRNALEEAMEEIALGRAIREGMKSRNVTRRDVTSILKGKS